MPDLRKTVLCLALLTLVPSFAWAGTARLAVLGAEGGYLADPAEAATWYATLAEHRDLLLAELGDVIGGGEGILRDQGLFEHGARVHLGLDPDGRLGIIAFGFQDRLDDGPDSGAFTAQWAGRFGAWTFGTAGRFSTFGLSSNGSDVGDRIDSSYDHRYGVGVKRALGEDADVELAGEVVNSKSEGAGALYRFSDDSWRSFGLRARARFAVAGRTELVPVLEHTRLITGMLSDLLAGPADRDARLTRLGLGAVFDREDGALVLIAAEYRTGRDRHLLRADDIAVAEWTGADRDFYQIRGIAGLEQRILPWLAVRVSARYVRLHEETSLASAGAGVGDPPGQQNHRGEGAISPLAFGLGVERGSLVLDLAYNDSAPVNPGLTGQGLTLASEHDGFTALTLTWRF